MLDIGLGPWQSRYVCCFIFNVFPFPFSWIGKMRQLGTWFFLQCALPIDAPNTSCVTRRCSANRKKICEIKFGNYWRSKFGPRAYWPSYLSPLHRKQIQNGGEQFAAFFLFMGTSSKDCALLDRNGNTLKLKTTAKLNSKQTSIATVQDLYQMYATLLTPPDYL
jgi:hypothetical protein